MTHAELRSLLAYDGWANARWMGLLAGLPEELLEMPTGGSFPSLRALAAHIVAVHRGRLADNLRRLGVSPAGTDLLEFTGSSL